MDIDEILYSLMGVNNPVTTDYYKVAVANKISKYLNKQFTLEEVCVKYPAALIEGVMDMWGQAKRERDVTQIRQGARTVVYADNSTNGLSKRVTDLLPKPFIKLGGK